MSIVFAYLEPEQQKVVSTSDWLPIFPIELWTKIVHILKKKKISAWKEEDIPALLAANIIY